MQDTATKTRKTATIWIHCILCFVGCVFVTSGIATAATTYKWDPDTAGGVQGGTGIWNESDAFWTTDNGTSNTEWVNGASSYAFFSGTAGTVEISSGTTLTAGQLNIPSGAGGYVVEGNGTLLLDGTEYVRTIINGSGGTFELAVDVTMQTNGQQLWNYGASTLIINGDLRHDAGIASPSLSLSGNDGTHRLLSATSLEGSVSWGRGLIQIGNNSAFGTATINLADQSTLEAYSGDRVITNTLGTFIVSNADKYLNFQGTNRLEFTQSLAFTSNSTEPYSVFMTTDGTGDIVFSGSSFGAGASRARDLVKEGTGRLVMGGTLNHGGQTLVNDGTLLINGDNSGVNMAAIVVNNTATLGGSGTIGLAGGGTVTVNAAGTLAPGNTLGTLTVEGDLDLYGTLEMEIAGTGAGQFDVLDVNGTFKIFPGAILNIVVDTDNYMPVGGETWAILDVTGLTLLGGFTPSNILLTGIGGYFTVNTDNLLIDGTITLEIPEPASVALLGLAALAGLRRRRG